MVELLRACAAGALRTGGAESAAAYLRRALAEPPPPAEVTGLSLELGMAEALTNAPAAIEPPAGRLRRHAGPADPRADRPHPGPGDDVLRRRAGRAARWPARRRPPCRDALEDERRALEAFALICVYFEGGAVEEIARAREHRHLELGAGAGARMLAAVAALQWAYSDGSAAEARRARPRRAGRRPLVREDNGLLSIAATLRARDGRPPGGDGLLGRRHAEGHARGSLFSISSVHLWRGFTLMRRGDLVDAIESLEQALDEFELYGYGADAKLYAAASSRWPSSPRPARPPPGARSSARGRR